MSMIHMPSAATTFAKNIRLFVALIRNHDGDEVSFALCQSDDVLNSKKKSDARIFMLSIGSFLLSLAHKQ
jgi:hypothetical protein